MPPSKIAYHKVRKLLPRYEWREEKTERGSHRWQQKVGEDDVELTIEVDLDALLDRLAKKAWRNKSKRSTMCWGLVKVTAKA